ncbi:MAG: hypothetical protein N4A33_07060 [Bacteriovoracaceae bacterium]|jgi:uncharacterized membrane protein YjfL (UPF0719 family)|nr:hypothetical protein [Bacteriovoracaceae bacterium]
MNEIFDKLLIRILFTLFICVAMFLYKYAHIIFYPSKKKQVLRKIYPSENSADTLHLFGRLIGIAIIFSALEFNQYAGFAVSVSHFFIWGSLGLIIYLLSLWMIESIIFYNFVYKDEVIKKENLSYALVSFTTAISIAFLIKNIFNESEKSIIILTILWFYKLVLFGFLSKIYRFVSKLNFNSLMIQKNLSLGASYSGFILGISIILVSSMSNEHTELLFFLAQIFLKVLISSFVFPLFKLGINYIFKIQANSSKSDDITQLKEVGFGIYEGSTFITSALLTSIIIEQIHFGTIYPFF